MPVPNLRRRVWLLLLLDSVERAALTPIPGVRLHRLAFLANCLSPVYDVPVQNGRILKYKRGPFYADLQWDLDRMVLQGLAEMSDIAYEDKFGPWLMANYALSRRGRVAVTRVLGIAPWATRVHPFLLEVASAFGMIEEGLQEEAPLQDATYSDPLASDETIIDFAEWDRRNYTHGAVNALSAYAPDALPLDGTEKLHLYFRYLERMVRRAAS